jgi:hypothetical protein
LAAFTRSTKIAILGTLCAAALWPTDLFAQRRAVQRPAGRSVVVVGARPYYRPYYYPYYSRFYAPYYSGFYGSYYSPFFWGPYAQYPYPPYYYGRWAYDYTGSARLQVTPKNTQVYVDGYFVGVADEFDGSLQRLNVEAGEHELQFYLDGHQPYSIKVLLARGRTLKIAHVMQPLGPGETAPPPPKPTGVERPEPYAGTSQRQGPPPARGAQPSQFGSLLLRVRPSDASILVDGEEWTAPAGEDQFVIELTDGPHRIEVRKSGFQTYSTTVRVRRGDTVRLNVSLTAGGLSGEF